MTSEAEYDPEHPCPDNGQFTATCRYYERAKTAEARAASAEAIIAEWADSELDLMPRVRAAEAEAKLLRERLAVINERGATPTWG